MPTLEYVKLSKKMTSAKRALIAFSSFPNSLNTWHMHILICDEEKKI